MYYKLAILNSTISYNNILSIINNISNFYLIITPTTSLNHYIIYFILNNNSNLNKLYEYQSNIIYNYKYNIIIYKIFRLFLTYNNINNFIFIDFAFYNLQNIIVINKLKLNKYINIFNINKKIKYIIEKFFTNKSSTLSIYHSNKSYLHFINNFLTTYNINIISLDYYLIHKLYDIIINKLNNNYTTTLYLLFNITNNKVINYILKSLQDNIKKIKIEYKKSKLYCNILFLLESEKINTISSQVKYYTFNKLIY